MSDSSNYSSGDLDRLIAVCDEITALVQVGMPIERAFMEKSRSIGGDFGLHLEVLSRKLSDGQSLADAVRDDPTFPPVFAAVLEAGIISGKPAAALDAIVENAREIRELRRFMIRTMIYPLVLFSALWAVFIGMFFFVAPRIASCLEDFEIRSFLVDFVKFIEPYRKEAVIGSIVLIAFFWIMFLIWAIMTSRGTMVQASDGFFRFGWIPWLGKATVLMKKSLFARLLGMLIRASVPLDRAIQLACKASGDRYFSDRSRDSITQNVLDGKIEDNMKSPIASLINWSLGISDKLVLVEGLEHYADIAKTRSEMQVSKCEMILPGAITLFFAVLISACYFLTVIWPYIQVLTKLTAAS